MKKKYKPAKKLVKKYLDKWIEPLGLGWWEIIVIYYNHLPKTKQATGYDDPRVAARCNADWRYGKAYLEVSMREFSNMDEHTAEVVIIHELTHILVNEMRAGNIDHEERVVTTLTKAFMWTRCADLPTEVEDA